MTTELQILSMKAMTELHAAEEKYLRTFGWVQGENKHWLPPPDIKTLKQSYAHSNAVNRQKSETITALRKRGRLPEHMTHNDRFEWVPKIGDGSSVLMEVAEKRQR